MRLKMPIICIAGALVLVYGLFFYTRLVEPRNEETNEQGELPPEVIQPGSSDASSESTSDDHETTTEENPEGTVKEESSGLDEGSTDGENSSSEGEDPGNGIELPMDVF